ncbi:MAG: efflux transporter periplasmic adaptor subunit [Deltaproteobacteria bacterium]|nr:efflux transporter periplasmic adaptor subunit [Deltaproteobacteria bacterium]
MNPKLLAPIVVVALTAIGVVVLIATAPSIESVKPERTIPTVRVIDATSQTRRYRVRSQGTVAPRTEADLVAEAEGRIVWIASTFAPGGFFSAGDPLVRLEARDYELTRDRRRASVQRARSERQFAAAELKRQEGLSDGGVASVSQLADAQRAATVAEANLLDAGAALEQAERDLERTEIRAPFDGRIREERVDVGQFVSRGAALARVYATDYAEIRLPIPDDQLAFLDAEATGAGVPAEIGSAVVRLSATFAGRRTEWEGRVVRTEGEIDPRSRMVNVVARVEDPYRADTETLEVPLVVGLFVQAEIEGPQVENVIVVPRSAMRNDSRILIVDRQDRLHSREVKILRIDRDNVLIQGPLATGERICVSPLQVVVEGMQVRTVEDAVQAENARS